ncbi:hypothetical protein [Azospirillum doebereinerae]
MFIPAAMWRSTDLVEGVVGGGWPGRGEGLHLVAGEQRQHGTALESLSEKKLNQMSCL